ncbi:MAG: hypothetical protein IT285_12805 [Bdellovibrionales bacterium]|nr:hypothetical protein [Bdellovibrionales bacterium]
MRFQQVRSFAAAALLASFVALSPAAQASVGLGVHGGWTFKSGGFSGAKMANPYFGAEILAGIAKSDAFQLGAFYDHSTMYFDDGATGKVPFIGGLVRIELQSLKGLFVDFKVGSTYTDTGSSESDSALGFGFGGGYRIALGKVVSLKPRIQYRSLPDVDGNVSLAQSTIDATFLLAFLF